MYEFRLIEFFYREIKYITSELKIVEICTLINIENESINYIFITTFTLILTLAHILLQDFLALFSVVAHSTHSD